MPSDNAAPPCHNRPPVSDVVRIRDGLTDDGRVKFVVIPHFSPDRCTQWDGQGIGPNGESFAEHHYGRRCEGCRWLPVDFIPVSRDSFAPMPKPTGDSE